MWFLVCQQLFQISLLFSRSPRCVSSWSRLSYSLFSCEKLAFSSAVIRIIASTFCESNGEFHFFRIQNCQYLCVFSGIFARSATDCAVSERILHIWHHSSLWRLFIGAISMHCAACFISLYLSFPPSTDHVRPIPEDIFPEESAECTEQRILRPGRL